MRKTMTFKALGGNKVFAKVVVTMNDGEFYVRDIERGIADLLTDHYLDVTQSGKPIDFDRLEIPKKEIKKND